MIKRYWHIMIPITIFLGFFGYKLSAHTLKDLGYQDLINVKGGMLAWEAKLQSNFKGSYMMTLLIILGAILNKGGY